MVRLRLGNLVAKAGQGVSFGELGFVSSLVAFFVVLQALVGQPKALVLHFSDEVDHLCDGVVARHNEALNHCRFKVGKSKFVFKFFDLANAHVDFLSLHDFPHSPAADHGFEQHVEPLHAAGDGQSDFSNKMAAPDLLNENGVAVDKLFQKFHFVATLVLCARSQHFNPLFCEQLELNSAHKVLE